jgi:superfamily II DNA/RNA helicase
VDRFRDDPGCRLFLSTDAGGVGLNLQTASVVINMDQPWNPAVLEQRTGRVHRLGQHRAVQVIDFIAQGTIEEGMLGLLGFKQSLFAGVLDGGQDEVFLGGTRLAKFMEGVERATGAIPAAMPAASEVPDGSLSEDGGTGGGKADGGVSDRRPAGGGQSDGRRSDGGVSVPGASGSDEEVADEAAASFDDTWGEVISAGAALLEKLTAALEAGRARKGDPASGRKGDPKNRPTREMAPSLPASLVARDEETGEPYLRVPVPKPETLRRIFDLLAALQTG